MQSEFNQFEASCWALSPSRTAPETALLGFSDGRDQLMVTIFGQACYPRQPGHQRWP